MISGFKARPPFIAFYIRSDRLWRHGRKQDASFGLSLLNALGSRYNYNALAQELTGYFWGCGRMTGRQNRFCIPDEHHSDMILGIGWNGMVSHQMPRAPIVLKEFSKNPDGLNAS